MKNLILVYDSHSGHDGLRSDFIKLGFIDTSNNN